MSSSGVTIGVALPEHVHRRLSAEARKLNTTVESLIIAAVQHDLDFRTVAYPPHPPQPVKRKPHDKAP